MISSSIHDVRGWKIPEMFCSKFCRTNDAAGAHEAADNAEQYQIHGRTANDIDDLLRKYEKH